MLHHFLISMLYIVLGCLFIYFKGMGGGLFHELPNCVGHFKL